MDENMAVNKIEPEAPKGEGLSPQTDELAELSLDEALSMEGLLEVSEDGSLPLEDQETGDGSPSLEDLLEKPGDEADPPEELPQPKLRQRGKGGSSAVIVTFLVRVLLAGVLFFLSTRATMTGSWPLWLRLAAFLICAIDTINDFVRDLFAREPLSSSFAFLVIACVTAGTDRFLMASIAILLFEVGTGLLDLYSGKRLDASEQKLDKLRSRKDPLLDDCLAKLSVDIESRSFKRIAYFKAFNRYFVWAVLALAVVIGIIIPLFDGFTFSKWLYRAGIVAVPVSFSYLAEALIFLVLDATGQLFAKKVYYRSADALTMLSQITSVVFNKTGVLTDGDFVVTGVRPIRISEDELLYLAAYGEAYSDHPLARSIRERAGIEVDKTRISRHTENRGIGNVVQLDGQIVSVGSLDLMEALGLADELGTGEGASVFVAVGKTYVGRIDLEDSVRPTAAETVKTLRKSDVPNVALMTGDNAVYATRVGREVGITEVYADCLPRDKLTRLRYILRNREKDDHLAVVSDSPEDGDLLDTAEVGLLLDPDAAVEALNIKGVDLLIHDDDPARVADAVVLSKRIYKQFRRIWIVALVLNGLLTLISALGLLSLWVCILVELTIQALLLTLAFDGGSLRSLFR